ncbi:MAG: hypothetical protein AAFX56_00605 [Pseudomonadota bacterium]
MRAWILWFALLAPAIATAQTGELEGTWLLINDQGQPSYIAFKGDLAIYRNRLSTVTVNNSKHHSDTAAEAAEIETFLADNQRTEQLSDAAAEVFVDRLDLPDMDDATRAAGTNELSDAFRKRLRERLQGLLDRLQDAAKNGDGTLTRLDLTFISAGDYSGEVDERRADISVSGDRLYLMINGRIWTYDRTSALRGEKRAEWNRRGHRAFERRLDEEYNRLFSQCVSLQRNEQPVEICRANRDRMAEFGVQLRPEFVLERYRDFDKPSETETAFWKNQLPESGAWSSTFPALDYCFDGHSTGESREAFTDRLAARGFMDTMWRMTLVSNAPLEKPRNWTQAEYMQWAPPSDQLFGSRQGAVFFRADGVLGYGSRFEGLHFDPRDRWSYENGEIRITWYNGTFESRIPLMRDGQMRGTTNFALAENIYLDLVLGNYDLLTKMQNPQSHPDYARLLPFAESSTCGDVGLSTTVVEEEGNPEPSVDWPTRAPNAFPTHWWGRTEMTDGSEHPDADTWEEMQRGAFYHLNESGVVGVNINQPAGYGYDKSAQWKVEGQTMRWTWTNWDTFEFELPASFDTEISAVGRNNPQYRMVLNPTDLLEPGTRRRAVGQTEKADAPEPARAPETVTTAPATKPTLAPHVEPEPPPPPQPTLAGCWKWSNGLKISLLEDGTAVNGIARGTWRAVSGGFEIEWPPIEDTLTLSDNGSRFDGKGLFGVTFSGARVGAGSGINGQWRRQDGVVLEFRADGSATAGSLNGAWERRDAKRYSVSWPVTDTISMSADTNRLDIVNQFGKATALRDSGC